jgi:salicylate hydroxylase
LRTYEDLRRERTAKIQLAARHNSIVFHLPDGPEQRARDRAMSAAGPGNPHPNTWIFDYDADQATAHL